MLAGDITAVEHTKHRLNEQLVAELDALGVHFLRGAKAAEPTGQIAPASLMALLAANPEARMRLALIPLLLRRPDYAYYVGAALQDAATGQLVLKCYYTAARYLQQKYRARLEHSIGHTTPLPDLFSDELGLKPSADPDEGLSDLAQRHTYLSGKAINWLGTYEHAAQRWLAALERAQRWAT